MTNENMPREEEQTSLRQEEIETMKLQIQKYQQQEVVDAALWRARARNPIAVRALLDWEHAKIEELDERIQAIRIQEPYLFYPENSDQPSLTGFSPAQGIDPQGDAFVSGFLSR